MYNHDCILMTKLSSSAPISMSLYTQSMAQCTIQPINQPGITVQDHGTIETLGIDLLETRIILNTKIYETKMY